MLRLARQCVVLYTGRVDSMITVMRDLVCISQKFYKPTLIAQLQGLDLRQDIRAMQERRITYKCEVCFDEKVPASKGGFCSNLASPHFFCGAAHNGCLSDMVSSQAHDTDTFARNKDSIVCAYCVVFIPTVVSTFDLSLLGEQISTEALRQFIIAGKFVVQTKAEVVNEKLQLQHSDEMRKLREVHIKDKGERMKATTEHHRLKIMEDILTLHCPHCNLVIVDFNGCFAVQHKEYDHGSCQQGCGLYFCGWCLEKFGTNTDCRNHVKACLHSLYPGALTDNNVDFNRVHAQLQRAEVENYLQNVVDAQEREEIVKALRIELND